MKIGRDIANQLPEVKSVAQVAAEMDLSPVMVRRIECRALYKLAMMIRAARAAGDL
jgi:DNA-directed RNA polymerase sigma subunit (sigma70/sigma32)